jgi:electron transport complex protein RnfG
MRAKLPGPVRQVLTSAVLLALIAVLGTGLLAGVNELTRDRIAEQERLVVVRQLARVLPAGAYDNAPIEDSIVITDTAPLGQDAPVRVYRARNQGQPVAVVFDHVAPDGYNGDIHLLTGVLADGRISGVRVISHKETPGLGDPIEIERSDWILGFDGRSLGNPNPQGWGVRRDGGVFDQFTGATISPRAVVEAVQRVLEYQQSHAAELFSRQEANTDE